MNYLSKTVSVYQCNKCLRTGRAEEWINDPYSGHTCEDCNNLVKWCHEEKAYWWSVGIYSTSVDYGGPEEGGWWYDSGYLVHPEKQRVFENFEEAKNYRRHLNKTYADHYEARGFTEKLPVRSFPEFKPTYC